MARRRRDESDDEDFNRGSKRGRRDEGYDDRGRGRYDDYDDRRSGYGRPAPPSGGGEGVRLYVGNLPCVFQISFA